MNTYVIGIDFGTDSVRTIIVDTSTGSEICPSIFYYPRWAEKKYCNPTAQQYRQHPADYIEGLENSIKDCLSQTDDHVKIGNAIYKEKIHVSVLQ